MVMPSPDWNLVTLKWAGVFLDGTPAEGSLTLDYNGSVMFDDDPETPLTIFNRRLTKNLEKKTVLIDGQNRQVGYAEFQVPASNDPDVQGAGGTYTLTENLNGGSGRKGFTFVADINAPEGVIWLNKIMPTIPTPGTPLSVVYYSDFEDLRERVDVLEISGGGGGGTGTASWSTITGKPATFPPTIGSTSSTAVAGNDARLTDARTPLPHTHEVADVNGLDTALTGKADTVHGHTVADVTGLQAALDAKGTSSLTLGTTSTTAKAGDYQPTWAQVTGKPSTFAPTIGSTASTAVAGNDARLTDARTPTAHNHAVADVTGLQTALDGKQAAGSYATSSDLTTGLAGKAAASHTHPVANISDSTVIGRALVAAADAAAARTAIGAGTSALTLGTTSTTAKAGDYAPAWAEVTSKPTTFAPAIGTTATTAVAGNDARLTDARAPLAHTHTVAQISDSTATGRSVVTAADAAAARTAIGAGTSSVVVGTGATNAKAGNWTPGLADLPAGSTHAVIWNGTAWPSRPTARTDITVMWIGGTVAPSGGLNNVDVWMKDLA